MAYRVSTETRGGGKVYLLHDTTTGASASILPSYGFNLFDLRLPVAGQVRPVIVAEPNWADHPQNPARNGVPILFPYPNRVRNATYDFQGKTYKLPVGLAPNAIHGFALDAPWEVVEEKADDSGASLTGSYQISRSTPKQLENWPADAVLQVRYTLAGRTLTMTVTVNNPTAHDLPYGFGIHPYFRLPLGPEGNPDQTQVILPASKEWILDQFLPTGEQREVEPRVDFRKGQPRRGLKLDDVLTGLAFEGDRCVCRLVDQTLKAEFRLSFDRNFRELVVYTPPREDDVISLEPYTQTTDAINLAAKGVDGGLRVLEHGGHDTMTIVMETVG
jgi:aldose 1-epimerase